MNWYSVTMDNFDAEHKSKADAVFYVQCNLCVDAKRRPKRIAPGLYELTGLPNYHGRTSTYYIGTAATLKAHGFEFPELG
jgi:hypothetical protein